MTRWKPSELGTIKMNTDDECMPSFGTGIGGVPRDHNGAVKLVFANEINN